MISDIYSSTVFTINLCTDASVTLAINWFFYARKFFVVCHIPYMLVTC